MMEPSTQKTWPASLCWNAHMDKEIAGRGGGLLGLNPGSLNFSAHQPLNEVSDRSSTIYYIKNEYYLIVL